MQHSTQHWLRPGMTLMALLLSAGVCHADDLTEKVLVFLPLFTESADLRSFVNLFLGENNVNDLQGLETVLVLDVDKDFFFSDQHRLDPSHLIVEPVPELDEVDAPAFGQEAGLQKVLPEVAEELAVIGAIELFVGDVAEIPDPEADDVVAGVAQLAQRLVQNPERNLGKGLWLRQRLPTGETHPNRTAKSDRGRSIVDEAAHVLAPGSWQGCPVCSCDARRRKPAERHPS